MLSNIVNVANNGLRGNAQILFLYAFKCQSQTLHEPTPDLPE